MRITATDAVVVSLGIQYEPWHDIFCSLKFDYAKAGLEFLDTYTREFYWGGGFSVRIRTPVGPIEYSVMKGKDEDEALNYISLGYKF